MLYRHADANGRTSAPNNDRISGQSRRHHAIVAIPPMHVLACAVQDRVDLLDQLLGELYRIRIERQREADLCQLRRDQRR